MGMLAVIPGLKRAGKDFFFFLVLFSLFSGGFTALCSQKGNFTCCYKEKALESFAEKGMRGRRFMEAKRVVAGFVVDFFSQWPVKHPQLFAACRRPGTDIPVPCPHQCHPWDGGGKISETEVDLECRRKAVGLLPIFFTSKVMPRFLRTGKKKIQPSFADTTAKQVVQNHKCKRGEKKPYLVILCSYSLQNCPGMLLNTHHFPFSHSLLYN